MKLTNEELDSILAAGGLVLNEDYNPRGSYRKDVYLFTRCTRCGVEAHYRLKYILEKGSGGGGVCRACYWRSWYGESKKLYDAAVQSMIDQGIPRSRLIEEGVIKERRDATWEEAEKHAREHGFDLVDLIRGDHPGNDVMIVKCRGCGRQTAERPADVYFGCTCGGEHAQGGVAFGSEVLKVERSAGSVGSDTMQDGTAKLLCESASPCLEWWDHNENNEDFYDTCTTRSRQDANWTCPKCGYKFKAPVHAMVRHPRCPVCTAVRSMQFDIEWEELKNTPVSDFPDLLSAWDDVKDPDTIPVTYLYPCHLQCPEGHHPTQTPYSYLKNGCMVCRGLATKALPNQIYLSTSDPELAAEWDEAVDGPRYTPDTVKSGSKRKVRWQCIACGHKWEATVRDREKRMNNRCPACGKVMGSLAWKYPQLAAEWSPNNPVSPWNTKPFGTLKFKPEWICSANPEHVWTATTATRINAGKGCPYCEKGQ